MWTLSVRYPSDFFHNSCTIWHRSRQSACTGVRTTSLRVAPTSRLGHALKHPRPRPGRAAATAFKPLAGPDSRRAVPLLRRARWPPTSATASSAGSGAATRAFPSWTPSSSWTRCKRRPQRASAPPRRSDRRISPNAALIAGVGTLLLALGHRRPDRPLRRPRQSLRRRRRAAGDHRRRRRRSRRGRPPRQAQSHRRRRSGEREDAKKQKAASAEGSRNAARAPKKCSSRPAT